MKYRRDKIQRKHWVQPVLAVRHLEGSFTLSKTIRDGKKFFNYFQMSTRTYDFLVEKLANSFKIVLSIGPVFE